MGYLSVAAISLVALLPVVSATTLVGSCPLLNAYYPPPKQYASSDRAQAASASAKANIEQALATSTVFGQLDNETTAFSVEVYSLYSDDSLFNYYFLPEEITNQSTSGGVDTLDSSTVFRIGSVSKLWTVYLFLITAGDASWNLPITNFVPELATIAAANKASFNEVDNVSWDTITVGALASQLAGIGRDAAYSPGFAEFLSGLGLVNQGGNSHSTCGNAVQGMVPCNRTEFFEDFPTQHPTSSPFNTPIYSNVAYQILSYALENITAMSMQDIFQKYLVDALNLTGTYYNAPPTTNTSLIPFNETASLWGANIQDEIPAGGYYSSLDDMRAIGKAMLNYTLLSPAQTRRWMKPSAFTADPNFAVGAPWEIRRAPGDYPTASWLYTKSGDIGLYSVQMALMPDLGLGFSVLGAGVASDDQVRIVADIIADAFVPALWAQAADEVASNYGGTYYDADHNTTIVVAVDESSGNSSSSSSSSAAPGLLATEFTLGGQDVLALLGASVGSAITMRLYPMGLQAPAPATTTTAAAAVVESWHGIFTTAGDEAGDSDPGAFSQRCISWWLVDQFMYGGVGLDEFLFTLDGPGGTAVSLENRVVGVSMAKTASGGSG
ncbi:beta-lactamase/transpeptidase-like protein [Xylariales sp. PMI_506]|nr:beta-lactamase/transpeptidase-like protein [Xylariales sp. PMI_506]